MSGILDPQRQGILAAAFAGMQGAGNSRMPRTMGEIIGGAGQAGMGAYAQAEQQRRLAEAQQQNMAMKQQQFGLQEQEIAAQKALREQQGLKFQADAAERQRVTGIQNEMGEALKGSDGSFDDLQIKTLPFMFKLDPMKAISVVGTLQEKQAERQRKVAEHQEKMEDKTLSREQVANLAREQMTLKAEIAKGNEALRGAMVGIARQNADTRGAMLGIAQQNADTNRMGLDIRRDIADNAKADRSDKQTQVMLGKTDKAITDFSNHLQQYKIPALDASVRAANDLLKRYEGKAEVPGYGVIEGSPLVPNVLRSTEAKDVRSAVQAVTNDLLNLYSGLAVTEPESARRDREMMNTGQFNSKDFKNAWQRTVARYNSMKGSLLAGQTPEALRGYSSRPGAMSVESYTPAFSATQPASQQQQPSKPKSKNFTLDGGGSVIGALEADGNYYVTRGGKKMRIEE